MTDPYAPAVSYSRNEKTVEQLEEKVVETPTAPSVPDGSVREVTEWVGDDKERARLAQDEENKRDNPRSSLTKKLDEIIAGD